MAYDDRRYGYPSAGQRNARALSGIITAIYGAQAYRAQQQQQQQEKLKNQFEMFKVMRDAGYDTRTAFEAISKGRFPTALPTEESLTTRKTRAEVTKAEAQARKATAEAEALNQPLPPDYELVAGKPQRKTSLRDLIAVTTTGSGATEVEQAAARRQRAARLGLTEEEIAQSEQEATGLGVDDTTPAWMKALQGFFGRKTPTPAPTALVQSEAPTAGYVIMTGPDGLQYKIPKANIAKAKQRGFLAE